MSFYYYNNRSNVKNKNIFLLTSSALFDIVSFKITTNKISILISKKKSLALDYIFDYNVEITKFEIFMLYISLNQLDD